MPETRPTPGYGTLFVRAVTMRCPVCGSGHLFHHWFTMVKVCPGCGLVFERKEGQFVGAVGMNTILTFGAILVGVVAGVVATTPDIPVFGLTALVVGIGLFFPILLYPFSWTTWTAIDLAMRPLEPGEAPGGPGLVVTRVDGAEGPSQQR